MKKFSFFFAALGVFFSVTTHAIELDRRYANITISSKFTGKQRDQIISDLNFLATIRGVGGSERHRALFGGDVDGSTYVRWFNQIPVEIEPEGRIKCPRPEVSLACAGYDREKHRGKIRLKTVFFDRDLVEHLNILIHEDSHFHYPFLHHFQCDTQIPGDNRDQCDEDLEGAYSTATVFFANLAKYGKTHVKDNDWIWAWGAALNSGSARESAVPEILDELNRLDVGDGLLRGKIKDLSLVVRQLSPQNYDGTNKTLPPVQLSNPLEGQSLQAAIAE